MNQYNISLMFAPNLFRSYEVRDPIEIITHQKLVTANFEIMIEHFEFIFDKYYSCMLPKEERPNKTHCMNSTRMSTISHP
jgi:hypothetical protein